MTGQRVVAGIQDPSTIVFGRVALTTRIGQVIVICPTLGRQTLWVKVFHAEMSVAVG